MARMVLAIAVPMAGLLAGCDTSTTLLEGWGWIEPSPPAPVAAAAPPPEAPAPAVPAPAAPESAAPQPATRAITVSAPVVPPSPDAPVTLAATTPLPTSLPADAVRLTGPQIQAAFTNVHESYTAIDMVGFMSEGAWLAGTMSMTWMKASGISGHLAGAWRVEGDERCVDYRSGYRAPETECLAIYRHGAGYLSVNPDGTLHGYHELTPR